MGFMRLINAKWITCKYSVMNTCVFAVSLVAAEGALCRTLCGCYARRSSIRRALVELAILGGHDDCRCAVGKLHSINRAGLLCFVLRLRFLARLSNGQRSRFSEELPAESQRRRAHGDDYRCERSQIGRVPLPSTIYWNSHLRRQSADPFCSLY